MTTEGFADDGTMLRDFAQLDLAQEMLASEQSKPWQMGHTARTAHFQVYWGEQRSEPVIYWFF